MAAALVGDLHQPTGHLVRVRGRHQRRHLALLDMLGQPVRAEHQHVAGLELARRVDLDVDLGFGAQAARQDVAVRMALGERAVEEPEQFAELMGQLRIIAPAVGRKLA